MLLDVASADQLDGRCRISAPLAVEIRRHNPVGDTLYINGEVTRVFAEDGAHYAEIAQTATNQDGELSVRAKAVVRLPSRSK